MKKVFIISLMAALTITGCQAEQDVISQDSSKVFTAIVDDAFCEGTKTFMDGSGNVLWKSGDQVSLFAGSTINECYQVSDASDGKTAATLNKAGGSGFVAGGEIDNNVAFYPYASTAELTKNGSNYVISKIVLPATQNYAVGSFGNGAFPMAAVTSSTEDMNLKFKNVLGGLKLQLKGTATITSISLTGNNNEILCGNAEVTVANGSTPSINMTDGSAKTVTLDCGAGVTLDAETATPFIIALPPMTMTSGFTVVVTDSESKQMEIKTTKSQTITRSNLLKMPAVDYVGEKTKEATPLKFTSSGSTSISLTKVGSPNAISLEYKVDDGEWKSYTVGEVIDLTHGQEVSFRAGASGNSSFSQTGADYYTFSIIGTGSGKNEIAASGNIMSLLSNEEKLTIPCPYCFYSLFSGCSILTTAPELPATSLAEGCYCNMFYSTSLTSAPELPATTLSQSCYSEMFFRCSSLTTAPKLPATTLAEGCYRNMFYGCTSLTTAPVLPATTLADRCYLSMFYQCTNLTIAPELPATTLAESCYMKMFLGCRSLTAAPELPATSLADNCYGGMFYNCRSLTAAPELPAKTLANNCYASMFEGCILLTTVSGLPATVLANGCYRGMFAGCTSLTTSPELPVTTLADYCYGEMFYNCRSLTVAPVLPATTLVTDCYCFMFQGCVLLTTAPELPATSLADNCYRGMFRDCTSLTTAPVLPATTLAFCCYERMFDSCSNLTIAPELPAMTLSRGCYWGMFRGCTKLSHIKALFITTPSLDYTGEWVDGVATTGTFVKSSLASWDVTGTFGVPSGWTILTE